MRARRPALEYVVTMDRDSRLAIPGGPALDAGEGWTPEHLLLAAVARCAVASFASHAARSGATASATVRADAQRRTPGRRRATCGDRARACP